MKETNRSGSLLIVSGSEKSSRMIAGLIDPLLCPSVSVEKTGSGARRTAQIRRFDVIVVNAPLSDEYGHELAADLAGQTTSGVILLVKSDVYAEVSDQVNGNGVLTVAKPLSASVFHQAVSMALAQSARLANLEREIRRLKDKLTESLVVGRAKCILMETRGMSEPEAHRYIEKQAMDTREPRREIAEEIIHLYES